MNSKSIRNPQSTIRSSRGIALILSLIITLIVFLMVGSLLYVLLRSTGMSGAGKRYASASDAADGSVNVLKDTINLAMWGESIGPIFQGGGACTGTGESGNITNSIMTNNSPCTVQIILPSAVSGNYTAKVTLVRLYSMMIPGGRIEFARSGGVGSTAIFFRITTKVVGPNNATAENAVLYRFVG